MSFVCHLYVLVYHLYVSRMYLSAIRMSFVCTYMSSVCHLYVYLFIYLFIYLINNLFEVDKFTKIQYAYTHKSSQTNWLIKVNYPILQKNSGNLLIKTKEKEKKGL